MHTRRGWKIVVAIVAVFEVEAGMELELGKMG